MKISKRIGERVTIGEDIRLTLEYMKFKKFGVNIRHDGKERTYELLEDDPYYITPEIFFSVSYFRRGRAEFFISAPRDYRISR